MLLTSASRREDRFLSVGYFIAQRQVLQPTMDLSDLSIGTASALGRNTASAVCISVLNLVRRSPQPQSCTEPSPQPRRGIMRIAQASWYLLRCLKANLG